MGAAAVLSPVFGSVTRQARELLAYDTAVRMPLPLCRRIGFVQLAPGCGASTAAAQVVTVLARRRAGMVLAIDASPSPHGLLQLVGVDPVPGPMSGVGAGLAPAPGLPARAVGRPGQASPGPAGPGQAGPGQLGPGQLGPGQVGSRPGAAVRAGARTAAEARAGLGRAASGCYGLDLRSGGPVPAGAWSAGVGPIARFYDVVATDWGLRHPARDLEPVLSSSHAVCLVVRAEDAAVRAAGALLHGLAGRPGTPPVVVALVGPGRGTRPGRLARTLPAPVVPVPHAARHPGRSAGIRLAAELMHPGRLP
jgi:hypothetical protein